MASPCGVKTCVALAAPGQPYCPVHRPEKVIARAKTIVAAHCQRVIDTTNMKDTKVLIDLKDAIMADLKDTL